jgi:hypothetical protein
MIYLMDPRFNSLGFPFFDFPEALRLAL